MNQSYRSRRWIEPNAHDTFQRDIMPRLREMYSPHGIAPQLVEAYRNYVASLTPKEQEMRIEIL